METFTSISNVSQVQSSNRDGKQSFICDILFVVVLYKTKLADSTTFNSLKKFVEIHSEALPVDLAILDNSPASSADDIQQMNIDWLKIHYLHDADNPGVSKSYNRAATLAIAIKKKWLFILDQDSFLPEKGLEQYEKSINLWKNYPVYAPILISKNTIQSPCNYYFFKASHIKNIKTGVNKLRSKNILNSGLLLNIESFLKAGGYDENVWLYFSDFVFFNRLKKHFKDFIIIDLFIEHDLSSSDYSNKDFAKRRFELYCEGAFLAYKSQKSLHSLVGYTITIGLRAIIMSFRLRDVSFVSIFQNNFLLKK